MVGMNSIFFNNYLQELIQYLYLCYFIKYGRFRCAIRVLYRNSWIDMGNLQLQKTKWCKCEANRVRRGGIRQKTYGWFWSSQHWSNHTRRSKWVYRCRVQNMLSFYHYYGLYCLRLRRLDENILYYFSIRNWSSYIYVLWSFWNEGCHLL